jgi:hypothetical protein
VPLAFGFSMRFRAGLSFTILAVILLAGCAQTTQSGQGDSAQGALYATESRIDSLTSEYNQCLEALYNSAAYDDLRVHLPQNISDATLGQLTDESKASQKEIDAVKKAEIEKQKCIDRYYRAVAILDPETAAILQDMFDELQQSYIKLVQKKISWGDLVSEKKSIITSAYKRAGAALQNRQMMAQQADQSAMEQRRANAIAGLQYLQATRPPTAQPYMMPTNQSVTTNCMRYGATINCRSY